MLALRFALAAIFILGLPVVNAQQSKKVETTQDLYEACKNAASPIDLNTCVSYISGVGDTKVLLTNESQMQNFVRSQFATNPATPRWYKPSSIGRRLTLRSGRTPH